MTSGKIHYTHFEATNPLLKKIRDLENRAIFSKPESYVKFHPGDCVLPESYNEYYDRVMDFPVENTDIWLVTMQKSGTAWAQEMIWLLENNCNLQGAQTPLHTRFPYLE